MTHRKHNPPSPAKMERRAALAAIRTILRNSVSTQAIYDGVSFDVALKGFLAGGATAADHFAAAARELPRHPNAKHFARLAEVAARERFSWNDLALREINLTPAESAMELAAVTRERDALREELARVRDAGNLAAEMGSLRGLAMRAFRTFENIAYDESTSVDEPVSFDADGSSLPSILLAYNLSDGGEGRYFAMVQCFEHGEDGDGDATIDTVAVALGDPMAQPLDALRSLRRALESEPNEDGMYGYDGLDDDDVDVSHNHDPSCPHCNAPMERVPSRDKAN